MCLTHNQTTPAMGCQHCLCRSAEWVSALCLPGSSTGQVFLCNAIPITNVLHGRGGVKLIVADDEKVRRAQMRQNHHSGCGGDNGREDSSMDVR